MVNISSYFVKQITLTHKRIVHGLLFGYFLAQLIEFEKYESFDGRIVQLFVKTLNITLLILVSSWLIVSWFQPSWLEKTHIHINAISFSCLMGWLVLCAPHISVITGFYVVNILISLCILSLDILQLINANQVFQSKFGCATMNDRSNKNNNKILTGNKTIRANSVFKSKHKFHSVDGQTSNEVLSTTFAVSGEKNRFLLTKIGLHDDKVIDAGQEIDDQSSNNFSANVPIFDGCRANMRLLPLNRVDSREVIPRDLTWECFSNVEHRLDSSSCHIYTAVWNFAKIPVILKLIKTERLASAVAVAEFETEENVLLRTKHPNIVRLLASGNNPRKFLVLELLSGGSLAHSLGERYVLFL
jgi:uncharacterized membrane protein (DUF485 family)